VPVYNLVCGACHKPERKLCTPEQLRDRSLKCSACGGDLVRNPDPPTTQVKEVLDNGLMTKRLERYANAERLSRDNSKVR
jgi:hypothetical protein